MYQKPHYTFKQPRSKQSFLNESGLLIYASLFHYSCTSNSPPWSSVCTLRNSLHIRNYECYERNNYSMSPPPLSPWNAGAQWQVYFQLLRVDCLSTPFGSAIEETSFDAACPIAASETTETTARCKHRRCSRLEPVESIQWVSLLHIRLALRFFFEKEQRNRLETHRR